MSHESPPGGTVFYDGHCGLCHRTVKYVLAHDPAGLFAFAPLGSPAFERLIPPDRRHNLPDSVIVLDKAGRLHVKSDATAKILKDLGGTQRLMGRVLALIPRPVRDLGYAAVARVRKKLFKTPDDACPMVPPELRARFVM